ncbi:DUF917 domain-containing protein [Streptomyces sp. NBC_00654]|uniref:DUF917 domain-containing protein n=1 Tax=Streptomyces sp. NBC_00654 TaxID=2975799 RepID=UPI002B1DEB03|nr:DUF917 domain-containing protein [Streptomyces sp. NBC_00654]
MHIDAGALADFARGCAVLGSGGGGPVAPARAVAAQAIEECGPVPVIAPDRLPGDALIMPVSEIGSPVVAGERIGSRAEPARLRARVEEQHGRPVEAVMSGEIGGLNGCLALAWAARLGLPLLDADSMGRAFPRMDQNVLELAGMSPGPAVLADEWGRTVILDHIDGAHLELLGRATVDAFGGRVVSSDYPLTAAQAAAHAVAGSVTRALRLGRRTARTRGHGDSGTGIGIGIGIGISTGTSISTGTGVGGTGRESGLSGDLGPAHDLGPAYDSGSAYDLGPGFTGKVSSVRRSPQGDGGEATGVLLEGMGPDAGRLVLVEGRSEFVAAVEDGRPLALVPDVICLLDLRTGETVQVESVRYGLRVQLLTLRSDPAWYTPQGLTLAGPAVFGLAGLDRDGDRTGTASGGSRDRRRGCRPHQHRCRPARRTREDGGCRHGGCRLGRCRSGECRLGQCRLGYAQRQRRQPQHGRRQHGRRP